MIRRITWTEARGLKIPLPIRVVGLLAAGLAAGLLYPNSAAVKFLYVSGTIFPRTIVTFAAFFIFHLLAAAMAKLMLFHKEKAGKMFGLILACIRAGTFADWFAPNEVHVYRFRRP